MARINISVCEVYRKEMEYILFIHNLQDAKMSFWQCECLDCSFHGVCVSVDDEPCSAETSQLSEELSSFEGARNGSKVGYPFMCQNLLVSNEFLEFYVQKGYYVATSGWMANWRQHVMKTWGFLDEVDKSLMKEMMPRVLLLDTLVYPDIRLHVDEFERETGIAVETIPVGIALMEKAIMLELERVSTRALKKESTALSRQISQQLMLLDIFPRLATSNSVNSVIEAALETLVILTGARVAGFRRYAEGCLEQAVYAKGSNPSIILDAYILNMNETEGLQMQPEQKGLHVVRFHQEVFGLLEVSDYVFEQYHESYEQLVQAVIVVFALAFANANHNERLTIANDHLQKEYSNRKRLFSYITHELRTPLNGISGYLQLLAHHDKSQSMKVYIDNAMASTRTMLALVNDLLNQAQMESGKLTIHPAPFVIQDLVRHVVSMVQPAVEVKGLDLCVLMKGSISGSFLGDELRISQILVNLLANAVKFSQSGTLVFSVSVLRNEEQQALLSFSVEDAAGGMSLELQERLFQPFSQAGDAASARGTGLGLSISMELANQMAGVLSVISKLGEGSLFSFHIVLESADEPFISVEPSADSMTGNQDPQPYNGGESLTSTAKQDEHPIKGLQVHGIHENREVVGPNILVVDDDAASRLLLSASLQKHGYPCDVAHHGAEALNKENALPYDIIFMDCQMPIMDGIEATRRIVDRHGSVRIPAIYAVTAYDLPHEREKYLQAGMQDVISKPISISKIIQLVENTTALRSR